MITGNSIVRDLASFAFDDIDDMIQVLKKQGIAPIDFGIGDPKEPTPEFIRKAAKESIDNNASRGYPIYNGTFEYRYAISKWNKKRFNVVLDPEKEICAAIGAKEIIFNLPNAFIEPEDYVIIPNPGYPPYMKGTLFARGIPYFLDLNSSNNFLPDFNSIPQDVLKKTKIIWLNYPNNPTGAVAPLDFYKAIVEFAKKHDILVVSDECYSELYFEETNRTHSILEVTKEGVLCVNSLSKRSCMTGWRIGWICGDEKLITAVKKLKTNIDSGIPYFIQDAAIAALADEKHVEEHRAKLLLKRDIIVNAFKKAGLNDCTPKGTFYIWQKLPESIKGLDLCKKLLEPKYAIVLSPGAWLAETINGVNPAQNYVRMALVPTVEECKIAAEKIIHAISSL
ncbi:MAG: aminotransferase class I/II-fold pyridoxal phosphate-dependent enzyme [Proteobacteria bacterium]|nr:aminotransferase class I/II-fold pyridoxal phosphate-dependent enzyme [Pseudomonadota bacterium]